MAVSSSQCTQCNKMFSTERILRRHVNTVHGTNLLVCAHCGMHFTRRDGLQRHINKKHSAVNEKRSPNKREFKEPVTEFSCRGCGRVFSKKYNRNEHERFVCTVLLERPLEHISYELPISPCPRPTSCSVTSEPGPNAPLVSEFSTSSSTDEKSLIDSHKDNRKLTHESDKASMKRSFYQEKTKCGREGKLKRLISRDLNKEEPAISKMEDNIGNLVMECSNCTEGNKEDGEHLTSVKPNSQLHHQNSPLGKKQLTLHKGRDDLTDDSSSEENMKNKFILPDKVETPIKDEIYERKQIEAINDDIKDETDMFFKSMAVTAKTFHPTILADLKMKISDLVMNHQLEHEKFESSTALNQTSTSLLDSSVSFSDGNLSDEQVEELTPNSLNTNHQSLTINKEEYILGDDNDLN